MEWFHSNWKKNWNGLIPIGIRIGIILFNLFPIGRIGMVLFQLESELEWFHSNLNGFIPMGIRIGMVHFNLFPIGGIGILSFQFGTVSE